MTNSLPVEDQTLLVISLRDLQPVIVQDLATRTGGPATGELQRRGGRIFDTSQQRIKTWFETPRSAIEALLSVQQKLAILALAYHGQASLHAALHAGPVGSGETLRYADYLLATAHPGQVLLSSSAFERLDADLPPHVEVRDLGVHRLKDLTRPRHIYQILAPCLVDVSTPLRTIDAHPNNLPILPGSLVGRERDVSVIARLFNEDPVRLITLVGPSGTGKSRLSLQVAAELIPRFDHGVYFVALATLDDPELLVPTIARALGVRQDGNKPMLELLKDSLHTRHLLLVFDNFEHLISVAPVISVLLQTAPQLRVLVSSQIPLGLAEEYTISVPPLGMPLSARLTIVETLVRYPAVALFVERARAANPHFALSNDNRDAVAGICLQLQGLPFAIELAAAYSDRLTPEELLIQLQQHQQQAGVEDQKRTLRTTLAWSYTQLAEEEKLLFARLSVFSGGVAEDIVAVCASGDLDPRQVELALTSLSQRSLLMDDMSDGAQCARWSMLDMARAYAATLLARRDETEVHRSRHAAHFLSRVQAAAGELTGPGQQRWLTYLDAEYGNLRRALHWLLETGHTHEALSFVSAFWKFWQFRGYHTEGRRWIARVIEAAAPLIAELRAEPGRRDELMALLDDEAKSLTGAGWMASDQGDFVSVQSCFEESLALFREVGNRRGIGLALQGVASIYRNRGDYARAKTHFEESLQIFMALEDREEMAWVMGHLGITAHYQGLLEIAERYHIEALAEFEALGHGWGIAVERSHLVETLLDMGESERTKAILAPWIAQQRAQGESRGVPFALALAYMGEAELAGGAVDRADQVFSECLALSREEGFALRVTQVCNGLGRIAIYRGDYQAAHEFFEEGLLLQQEQREAWQTIRLVDGVADLAFIEGRWRMAAHLYAMAHAVRLATHMAHREAGPHSSCSQIEALKKQLGATDFETIWQQNHRTTLEQALAEALAYLSARG